LPDLTDPVSYHQAMNNRFAVQWREAMKDELKSMAQNSVWELKPLPERFKTVDYKWVFKTKRDSEGKVERFKARLVAKGFKQCPGIDYDETFLQFRGRTLSGLF